MVDDGQHGRRERLGVEQPEPPLGGHVEAEHQLGDVGDVGDRDDQLLPGEEGERLRHDLRVVAERDPHLVAEGTQRDPGREGRAERVTVGADVTDQVDRTGPPDLRDQLLPDQFGPRGLGARARDRREGALHREGG